MLSNSEVGVATSVLACASLGLVEVIATLARKRKAGAFDQTGLEGKMDELIEDWDEFIPALAQQLANMPTRGLALTKKALNTSLTNNLDDQLAVEEELQQQLDPHSPTHWQIRTFPPSQFYQIGQNQQIPVS